MPAIQPVRLKQQTAQLGDSFSQPDQFIRRLHELLDFYTDRTLRPGQNLVRHPRLPHYRIPTPVMRQLGVDLEGWSAQAGLESTLSLADALWQNGYFETRLLAVELLQSAAQFDSTALQSRLHSWIKPKEEDQILQALLQVGKTHLGAEWLGFARTWLSDDNPEVRSIGIRALRSLAADPAYQNIPAIFSLLNPFFQAVPVSLHPEVTDLVLLLAGRSPAETLYFLRRVLITSPDQTLTRLVRRCLPAFSPEDQKRLREAMLDRTRTR
jgi:hypothetical protein